MRADERRRFPPCPTMECLCECCLWCRPVSVRLYGQATAPPLGSDSTPFPLYETHCDELQDIRQENEQTVPLPSAVRVGEEHKDNLHADILEAVARLSEVNALVAIVVAPDDHGAE